MAEKLLMLALSPTMEQGVVVKWRKQEGETIAEGDVICDVETDKAVMEYESVNSGVLLKILVEEGESAEIGTTIGIIGEADEDISALLTEAPAPIKEQAEPAETKKDDTPRPAKEEKITEKAPQGDKIRSTPIARNLAKKHGVDLSLIRGSGPAGRIVKADVEKALKSGKEIFGQPAALSEAAESQEDNIIPLTEKRRLIAQRLSESKFSAPHYYLKITAVVDSLMQARKRLIEQVSEKISLNAFLIKFTADVLKRHPKVNATWNDDKIIQHGRVDVALAVAQEDGLITPVVRDSNRKGILTIDRELRVLIEKAQHGTLAPAEYSNSTFTISNLGMFDIEEFTAIINPPNSAILTVGKIGKSPVADDDGRLQVQSVMKMTLSCDHRLIDGAGAPPFSRILKETIEYPVQVLY